MDLTEILAQRYEQATRAAADLERCEPEGVGPGREAAKLLPQREENVAGGRKEFFPLADLIRKVGITA